MKERDFPKALELLRASDRATRTELTLAATAEVLERLDRLQSAHETWALVIERAREERQLDWIETARLRMAAIEPSIPTIRFVPDPDLPASARVWLEGRLIERSTWNTPRPVDCCYLRLRVEVPGRPPWTDQALVHNGYPTVQVIPIHTPTANNPRPIGRPRRRGACGRRTANTPSATGTTRLTNPIAPEMRSRRSPAASFTFPQELRPARGPRRRESFSTTRPPCERGR